MTKEALRREEREREARGDLEPQNPFADTPQSSATPQTSILDYQPETTPTTSTFPHMEPPPPYDEPHRRDSSPRANQSKKSYEQDSCLNLGPGQSSGCMNINMSTDDRHRVEGCMNYSSGSEGPGTMEGCMNLDSKSVS